MKLAVVAPMIGLLFVVLPSNANRSSQSLAFVASPAGAPSVTPLSLVSLKKQGKQQRPCTRQFLERGDQQHKPEGHLTKHHDHNNPSAQQQAIWGDSSSSNSRTSKSSTELASYMSSTMPSPTENAFKVFCDLDGVLVDFERGVQTLLHRPSSKLVKGTMWKNIARANAFYEHLPWTQDGRKLWSSIRKLKPDILTGVPYPVSSRIEKFNWCSRELGLDQEELRHCDMAAGCRDHESVNGNIPIPGVTNIITCWSNNKHMECTSRAVLIDDRDSLRANWERAGGIFIHHVDAENTIRQLREYGILVDDENESAL